MWAAVALSNTAPEAAGALQWYTACKQDWDGREPSDSQMVGGYVQVFEPDIRDSAAFVRKIMTPALAGAAGSDRGLVAVGEAARGVALLLEVAHCKVQLTPLYRAPLCADVGAGVGRVAEGVLLHIFQEVDLVEPSGENPCCYFS